MEPQLLECPSLGDSRRSQNRGFQGDRFLICWSENNKMFFFNRDQKEKSSVECYWDVELWFCNIFSILDVFSSKQVPAVQTLQRSLFLVDIRQLAQESRCCRRSLRENCCKSLRRYGTSKICTHWEMPQSSWCNGLTSGHWELCFTLKDARSICMYIYGGRGLSGPHIYITL